MLFIYKDGTPGDLYPLAIKYAADLSTDFDDVLSALEQLRKRQLSNRTYDDMVMVRWFFRFFLFVNKFGQYIKRDQFSSDMA